MRRAIVEGALAASAGRALGAAELGAGLPRDAVHNFNNTTKHVETTRVHCSDEYEEQECRRDGLRLWKGRRFLIIFDRFIQTHMPFAAIPRLGTVQL